MIMRRKDRQVTDLSETIEIFNKCDVCRLGMVDNGMPYIVPINFGFEFTGAALTLYLHSAKEGKKIDILRQNPFVSFEMDCGHELIAGTQACNYGYKYESVIGNGNAVFVEDYSEKIHALKKIMAKYTGNDDFNFSPDKTNLVTIIKVRADEYTAKRR